MAEAVYRVELTASFLERLDAIEAFLSEADAAFAFDNLLAGLRTKVIPNLARFPRIGRRYLDNPPQSAPMVSPSTTRWAWRTRRSTTFIRGNAWEQHRTMLADHLPAHAHARAPAALHANLTSTFGRAPMNANAPRTRTHLHAVAADDAVRQARVQLAAANRLAVHDGLEEGIDNHFTMVVPGTTDRFLVLPFGLHWSEARASDLIVFNEQSEILEGEGSLELSALRHRQKITFTS